MGALKERYLPNYTYKMVSKIDFDFIYERFKD